MTQPLPVANGDNWPIKVLLVDDQKTVGGQVRQWFTNEPDVEFLHCADPAAAIDAANEFRPTVILQDLVMPDIDGLLLVKFYRANAATRETPLIVLSSKEEPTIKARAFALGANDYMVKFPSELEVLARVRYHSRGYINLLQRNEAYRQLAEKERVQAEDLARAARYAESLLPSRMTTGPVAIDWRFIPSTQLGGDMFGYHWLDPDHLAVYLLDVSGHGVGSSLLAVSAATMLKAQSLSGTDFRNPGQVITRLNDVFQMERQDGKYFTIWYGVYQPGDRSLAYCNAGHPAALLSGGESLGLLDADGPAVGMVPELPYDTRTVTVAPTARLMVYSDGVYEIEKPDGAMWQHHEFVQHIGPRIGEEHNLIDQHLAFVHRLRGGAALGDDFSMMEVRFGESAAVQPKRRRKTAGADGAAQVGS
jgi:sigma-B regulation protein RsbU (phosphoserine phosphatase)